MQLCDRLKLWLVFVFMVVTHGCTLLCKLIEKV
jgi:hypothetical protein